MTVLRLVSILVLVGALLTGCASEDVADALAHSFRSWCRTSGDQCDAHGSSGRP